MKTELIRKEVLQLESDVIETNIPMEEILSWLEEVRLGHLLPGDTNGALQHLLREIDNTRVELESGVILDHQDDYSYVGNYYCLQSGEAENASTILDRIVAAASRWATQ